MIEDVVTTIISTLQSNLPTELNAIEAARSVTITDVANSAYFSAEIPQLSQYPAIMVIGRGTQLSDHVGRGATNVRSTARHGIDVWVVVDGSDRQAMDNAVKRYVEGIDKVFRKNGTLSGAVTALVVGSHSYGDIPFLGEGDLVFRQGGGLALEVTEIITAI